MAPGTIHPTLPYDQAFGLPLEAPVATWFDRACPHGFASSRIPGGLVDRAP